MNIEPFTKTITDMRKITLTILLVAVVAAVWAQKPDKKTAKLEKQLVGTFVEVPAGHYTIRNSNGDTTKVTVAGFRMLETEVTNASYNLFLEDLKAQGRMSDYEKAKVDTTRNILVTPYFTHPICSPYPQYPVSRVSYDGAMLFCQWLTEKMGGDWEYTLPTKEQWKYAARAGNPLRHFSAYSMDTPYLTNYNGKPLYNYLNLGDEYIAMQEGKYVVLLNNNDLNYSRSYPVHVYSFHPNGLGLFNMCGNVAEMVYERGIAYGGSYLDPGYDIRIDSEKPYDAPSPLIGFRVIAVKKS